ncbi:MAG: hypothetical protein O4861_00880 [Trichodesmium sp. St16_bin4-tuft]|nr:hypothetical protein [Trichodesmium sp. MAG_R01]MDE5069163.1 hypothetical protein [Trichodesmium sp. St4_bin8_1]MDE5074279.1 hypothetical protein [Trichodesmium sp. St5_bin8]MDE5077962.1 hypothetical protein [Trichodesmium sp. St2_bin6]MDE5092097.1 hypothetical protein [Trichodesmium sp. St18_bin3_1_1]MDE5096968.1 hypothetical protein [Trichodesmium sp. St16_bin4-tuft]MDE5103581.1 hypothetical protein [Trichodesmium sp. St19_bin2]
MVTNTAKQIKTSLKNIKTQGNIKTSGDILSSSAVRGCLSCESIKGDKTRVLETARILVAQNKVLSRQK